MKSNMSSTFQSVRIKCVDLTDIQILNIESLIEAVWPELINEKDDQSRLHSFRENNKTGEVILINSDDLLVSHTKIFPRTIFAGDKSIEVTALAGVAVLDKYRGYGLGKLMIKEVFKLIGQNKLSTCLFQTTIPEFYEKLGARTIENRFFNSKNLLQPQVNPWWNPNVMIYPENAIWPKENIDLNGEGF